MGRHGIEKSDPGNDMWTAGYKHRKETYGFHEIRGISVMSKELLAPQEEVCPMDMLAKYLKIVCCSDGGKPQNH
jgi:hypothetical protein